MRTHEIPETTGSNKNRKSFVYCEKPKGCLTQSVKQAVKRVKDKDMTRGSQK